MIDKNGTCYMIVCDNCGDGHGIIIATNVRRTSHD